MRLSDMLKVFLYFVLNVTILAILYLSASEFPAGNPAGSRVERLEMRYLQVGLPEVPAGPKLHQFLLFRNSSKFWPSLHLHAELEQQQSEQLGL